MCGCMGPPVYFQLPKEVRIRDNADERALEEAALAGLRNRVEDYTAPTVDEEVQAELFDMEEDE